VVRAQRAPLHPTADQVDGFGLDDLGTGSGHRHGRRQLGPRRLWESLKVGMRAVWVSHGRQSPEQQDDVLIVGEIAAAVLGPL
jgi:hypothetical protein